MHKRKDALRQRDGSRELPVVADTGMDRLRNRRILGLAAFAFALVVVVLYGDPEREERAQVSEAGGSRGIASTVGKPGKSGRYEKATFAAGCFWGVEAAFRRVEGVTGTRVGYTGGTMKDPTYRDVCGGKTGHAEAVEVTYDPSGISYEELLDVFWSCHDPTTRNRQGPDVGAQYRSAIFFHDKRQETAARASREKQQRSGRFRKEIVTEIAPAGPFYAAEEYHQQYLEKKGGASCGLN